MRQQSTDTVDKAVCTEESGAVRLEAVLVALVERKARALHAEQARRRARTHPLLLLLRSHVSDEEASIVGNTGERLPSYWCENEIQKQNKKKKLKLHTHRGEELNSPEQLEMERRRRKRRRHAHTHAHKPRKHRTLLVSAIDEQAKVIHVLDPDELPRRARYTIMVTACLLLFLCLLLVGVTLRMAPLIDDMAFKICLKFSKVKLNENLNVARHLRSILKSPTSVNSDSRTSIWNSFLLGRNILKVSVLCVIEDKRKYVCAVRSRKTDHDAATARRRHGGGTAARRRVTRGEGPSLRHSGGCRRALRSQHVGARGTPRSRSLLETFFPRFRRSRLPERVGAGPLVPLRALRARAARGQRRPDGARAHAAVLLVQGGCGSTAAAAPAPLFGGGVRARAALAAPYAGAAQQPRTQRAQPLAGAPAARARARGAAGGRGQGGAQAARGGRRRRVVLRAGAGVGARGGGHADAQLGAPRTQPNSQVLHVLRAAAPSSHPARERAADARRTSGGNRQSHPVVGGIALTPRYSPRPRLDNIRPAAAPPEEPPEFVPGTDVDVQYPHPDVQSMPADSSNAQMSQTTAGSA